MKSAATLYTHTLTQDHSRGEDPPNRAVDVVRRLTAQRIQMRREVLDALQSDPIFRKQFCGESAENIVRLCQYILEGKVRPVDDSLKAMSDALWWKIRYAMQFL